MQEMDIQSVQRLLVCGKKRLNAIPNSEEFKSWYDTFTFDGKTPEPGQMHCACQNLRMH